MGQDLQNQQGRHCGSHLANLTRVWPWQPARSTNKRQSYYGGHLSILCIILLTKIAVKTLHPYELTCHCDYLRNLAELANNNGHLLPKGSQEFSLLSNTIIFLIVHGDSMNEIERLSKHRHTSRMIDGRSSPGGRQAQLENSTMPSGKGTLPYWEKRHGQQPNTYRERYSCCQCRDLQHVPSLDTRETDLHLDPLHRLFGGQGIFQKLIDNTSLVWANENGDLESNPRIIVWGHVEKVRAGTYALAGYFDSDQRHLINLRPLLHQWL